MASWTLGLGLWAMAAPTALHAASVAELEWLAGCWRPDRGDAGSIEQWTAPAGGTMLGVSRSVRAGRTVGYEFVLLREVGEGRIEYTARPSGQAEATFVLVRLSDSEVVFENPEHDFPQRISYRLDGPERLMARIEGEIQGQSRALDFPMRRISCAADPEGPAEPEE